MSGRLAALILVVATVACGGPGGGGSGREGGPAAKFIETGELRVVRSEVLSMPWFNWDYGRPQVVFLEEEGKTVKTGDLVAEIDKAGLLKFIDTRRAELQIAQGDLEKLRLEQQTRMLAMDNELTSALSALEQAAIDTQRVEYESESRRKLARLQYQRAWQALGKVRERLESSRLVNAEESKIQQARIVHIRSSLAAAESSLGNFSLRAPAPGLVVHSYGGGRQRWQKVKIGDQPFPGTPIIQLPDLRRMKVATTVDETDINRIEDGQAVMVRVDAFPNRSFHGTIIWISHTCRSRERGSKIKVFDVEVQIEESDPILKPGMTVSCEFTSNG